MLAACSRAPRFETFDDPWGDYRLETPQDWQTWGSHEHRKPINAVMFVGKLETEDDGIPLGAVLSVTKLYRRRADYPGKASQFEKYRDDILAPSGVLFGDPPSKLPEPMRKLIPKDVADVDLSGLPAKTYRREYEHPLAGADPLQVELEDVVVRTPEAYFVIEYRATRRLFDRYHFAMDHARESFSLRR